VLGPEYRDRRTVERGHPSHSKSLGGSHQNRVRQPRPVLGSLAHQFRGAEEIGRRRPNHLDGAAADRTEEREGCAQTSSLWSSRSSSARVRAPIINGSSTRPNQATRRGGSDRTDRPPRERRWSREGSPPVRPRRVRVEVRPHGAQSTGRRATAFRVRCGRPPRTAGPARRREPRGTTALRQSRTAVLVMALRAAKRSSLSSRSESIRMVVRFCICRHIYHTRRAWASRYYSSTSQYAERWPP